MYNKYILAVIIIFNSLLLLFYSISVHTNDLREKTSLGKVVCKIEYVFQPTSLILIGSTNQLRVEKNRISQNLSKLRGILHRLSTNCSTTKLNANPNRKIEEGEQCCC